MLSRREFLKRLAACGLVAASPKFIFDMGKNSLGYSEEFLAPWKWMTQEEIQGFYMTKETLIGVYSALKNHPGVVPLNSSGMYTLYS